VASWARKEPEPLADPEAVAAALNYARTLAHLAEPAYAPGDPRTDHSGWDVHQLRTLAETAPANWPGTRALVRAVSRLQAAEAGVSFDG
jgi:hypothetical protein